MARRRKSSIEPLEVTVTYEPSRLAADHLIDAYGRVIPQRKLPIPNQEETSQNSQTDQKRSTPK